MTCEGMDNHGASVYREDYSGAQVASFKCGDRELVCGLWYYDEKPRYGKRIEALLDGRKR